MSKSRGGSFVLIVKAALLQHLWTIQPFAIRATIKRVSAFWLSNTLDKDSGRRR